MKKSNIKILLIGMVALLASSCLGDLDVTPIDPNVVSSGNVYNTPEDYKKGLAKLYATFALSGQQGPAGQPDIEGIDEGFGNYLRQYWNHQELTTDEAVLSWNDATIKDFHWHTWSSTDVFVAAMHSRIMYSVALCNEFIRASATSDNADIKKYHAEARFLRALAYSHGIDLFGTMPFVTEADLPGAFFPPRMERADLYDYVVAELIAIDSEVGTPGFEYGRADQGAVWMTLAKLYLNAEVYIGESKYDECIATLKKVIAAPYSLSTQYMHNFVADNNESTEMIFPITYDGNNTQSFGGMVYLVHSQIGGSMDASGMFGTADAWAGLRTTSALVEKFDMTNDSRALFWTDGQSLEINDIGIFTEGYAITKFRNRKLDGSVSNSNHNVHVDTDWPMYRLADAYLMYAEAVVRGGAGGTRAESLGYINALRARAYGDTSGNINDAEMTLDFILDERARELFWEGHRRTDLIRFGQFTDGSYQWPWKGNVAEGVASGAFRDIFPVPASQITANPNLRQNQGY